MKIQLILAGNYTSCQNTQHIWSQACQQHHLPLSSIELESDEGTALAESLNLKTFPALIVDGQVRAVGHPDPDKALELISKLNRSS